MLFGHGGNISAVIDKYKFLQKKILDFSSNLNPLRINPRIRNIITKSVNLIYQYPDPQCYQARAALSNYWGIDKDNFLIGNGSNELIHLIPRTLNCRRVLIYQPTFSEYELSIKISGAKPYFILSKIKNNFRIDIKKIINFIPKVDLVILCNPNNPTGSLLKKDELINLLNTCKKNKKYLLIDEVFMDFVENENIFSVLKEAMHEKYLLVLRSLTKIFSLPGIRIGYLVADKNIIRKISLFQPTWSVNVFAQNILSNDLLGSDFIKKTKSYIKKERDFLFKNLQTIRGIYPYYPNANFIFCKITDKKIDAKSLFLCLIKYGIIIRDCSNFKGLSLRFFRIAVKKRKDNLYLVECLRKIF